MRNLGLQADTEYLAALRIQGVTPASREVKFKLGRTTQR